MKKVGIVICNYNKENAVLDCIQSILESDFQDFDLYVVDNGSTDKSVQRIEKKYPENLKALFLPYMCNTKGGKQNQLFMKGNLSGSSSQVSQTEYEENLGRK